MEIGNYNFVKTCSCSPEQYDVFDKDGNQVAYVRLRWGYLSAEYPDVGGVDIYNVGIGDGFAGCFESDEQRNYHLSRIATEIDKYINYTCADCDDCELDCDDAFCTNPFSDYCDRIVNGNRICSCFNIYNPRQATDVGD
jgi:hypothetical protein